MLHVVVSCMMLIQCHACIILVYMHLTIKLSTTTVPIFALLVVSPMPSRNEENNSYETLEFHSEALADFIWNTFEQYYTAVNFNKWYIYQLSNNT